MTLAQPLRVLLLQGQSVYDASSGAAQSMRQMAEALAAAGCDVRSLCTTGCENGASPAHWLPALRRQGQPVPDERWPAGLWLKVRDRGVMHHALVTAPERRHHWVRDHGAAFDARLDTLLDDFAPQAILTFGADASDQRRYALARQRGVRVVLVLHNLVQAALPRPLVDACWVPSHFMRARYQQAWGGEGLTVVPTPLAPYLRGGPAGPGGDEARVFVTFINPEPAKGNAVVAGLLDRWRAGRPHQPLLVVEGRGRAAQWLSALKARGMQADQCPQAFVAPTCDDLTGVWASSRVLLMPSVVDEAAGRVALEAMLNGVVPVVSDRGALPETVGAAEWVQPLPDAMDWRDASPAGEAVCSAWDRAVSRWLDDPQAWREASARAVTHAERHLYPRVAPRYLAALQAVLGGP